jgi:hypothetical protein
VRELRERHVEPQARLRLARDPALQER